MLNSILIPKWELSLAKRGLVALSLEDAEIIFNPEKHLDYKDYINKGIIQGGMIPKMECCMEAIEEGTKEVHLVDGRRKHSLITDVFEGLYASTAIKGGYTNEQTIN